MKKLMIGLALLLAIAIVLATIYREAVAFALLRWNLAPDHSFASATPPPAPDYRQDSTWAALPQREDNADLTPNGVEDGQANAPVDVFFIHPTTYYTSDSWNQPLDHEQANEFTDEQVLPNQAGVFNSCCRVFAPRYRQATLYSFFDDADSDGQAALALAYDDVKAAFEQFLAERSQGRPFIIAAHSQGSLHADRLLGDYIAGKPLSERLVAAYPVGFSLDGSNGVPVCRNAEDTGCQVTWNTLGEGAERFGNTPNDICVNPLTWRADGEPAGHAANLGGVSFNHGGDVEPAVSDARCEAGTLRVSEVRSENYSTDTFGDGNYHVYDYSLFHMNVRENAAARVAAYLSAQP